MHVSAAAGTPVLDAAGKAVGRVEDFVARLSGDGYPPVTGVLARADAGEVFVPIRRMATLAEGKVSVAVEREALTPFERRPGEVLLRRDVLGRQLIYIDERRRGHLVRAAEIELADREGLWTVAGIDAGRRRWWPGRRRAGEANECFVDWSHLEPFVSHVPTSRLRLRHRRLFQLHPGEVADLVEEASAAEAAEIIEAVGEDRAFEADVFEELDQEHQLELVAKRSDPQVAALLANMAPDDAADLLGEMERSRRAPVLAAMPAAAQQRLRDLLRYNPHTAGGLMSPGGLCLPPEATVVDALARVRSEEGLPETLDTVLVVGDDGVLTGAIRLLELLRAAPEATLGAAAHPDPPRVATSADLVEITLMMTDYNLTTLAVVDEGAKVVGVITLDDIVEHLVPENWRRRGDAAGE